MSGLSFNLRNVSLHLIDDLFGDHADELSRSAPPEVQPATTSGDHASTAAAGNLAPPSGNGLFGWLSDGVKDIVGGIGKGVTDVAGGIVGDVEDIGRGIGDATLGCLRNVAQGDFAEAASSVVRGCDRAVFQSAERLEYGLLEGQQDVFDGCADALGPIGEPLRWVGDRVFDSCFTTVDTVTGVVRDAARLVPDTAIGFMADTGNALRTAAKGDLWDATQQFGMAYVNAATHPLGFAASETMRCLQADASIAQTWLGMEPLGRRLTDDEIKELKKVYGNSIDYGLVRVKDGGWLSDNMFKAAHTVGNTVYLSSADIGSAGTLAHEVGHVWQNQNGGGDYIANAVFSNAWYQVATGDRNNAYDWQRGLANGESFATMNYEQRAQATEDIHYALADDNRITQSDGYTAEEVRFLRRVAKQVRHEEGAG